MPLHNSDISLIFNHLADLLEIKGENLFRVRAYRNAARTLEEMSRSAAEMISNGEDLTQLPGIGKDLAGKIAEIAQTGKLSVLETLKQEIPEDLCNIMNIAGIGPKRVLALHKKLGIRNMEELETAARAKKISSLPGFGEKTEERILEELQKAGTQGRKILLPVADEIAGSIVKYLRQFSGVVKIEIAGSYRRRKETVRDLDILASASEGSGIMEYFARYGDVLRVLSKGETRSTILLRSGVQVDLRVISEESYGAALHYFTGSKAHNIAIRSIGLKKGLKINEYGVFRGNLRIAGATESEVYNKLGLPYIEPELRENRGEIEAARQGRLPRLVSRKDIRGDLHSHTKLTDGRASLEEMAEAAKARGHEYLAITEHSKRLAMTRGLNEKRLAEQIREIDKLNSRTTGFTLLKGIEVDILEDGSLDLADYILKELDVVVCSVHSKFNLPEHKQTERIIRAMDNKYFDILGHPSGRLIDQRDPYDIDMERILRAAKERGCFLEVSADPHRLDLTDMHCKMTKEFGVKVAVSTDAHSTGNMDFLRYGLGQARRGWLEAEDVINTRSLEELKKLLKRN
jgi:DNA polymerase (family X)